MEETSLQGVSSKTGQYMFGPLNRKEDHKASLAMGSLKCLFICIRLCAVINIDVII